MRAIEKKLSEGKVVILDGAIGTELQRRGVSMDKCNWCASATLSHPEVLRAMHEDYIAAGAEVITANTFAAGRNLLGPLGLGDQVAPITRTAVRLAREARDAVADRPVAIAGSMSCIAPVQEGGTERVASLAPSKEDSRANYREMAGLLAEAGVDLLAMEMMIHTEEAIMAVEAAVETGLPVWVGFSCKDRGEGRLQTYHEASPDFADIIEPVMAVGGSVAGVMHSSVNDTTKGLEVLRQIWPGTLSAYPESGYFTMPDWQFVDVISPDDLAEVAVSWVKQGVQIVGGCCGLNPDHIRALAERMPERAGRHHNEATKSL